MGKTQRKKYKCSTSKEQHLLAIQAFYYPWNFYILLDLLHDLGLIMWKKKTNAASPHDCMLHKKKIDKCGHACTFSVCACIYQLLCVLEYVDLLVMIKKRLISMNACAYLAQNRVLRQHLSLFSCYETNFMQRNPIKYKNSLFSLLSKDNRKPRQPTNAIHYLFDV